MERKSVRREKNINKEDRIRMENGEETTGTKTKLRNIMG